MIVLGQIKSYVLKTFFNINQGMFIERVCLKKNNLKVQTLIQNVKI